MGVVINWRGMLGNGNITNQEFEAFKLEYEKASERYENVYRAVWQNFYYMAFFAGGIFAFGPDALPLSLLAAIGLTPLVFWFWASFLPLDGYGRQTRERLSLIEDILNQWVVNEDSTTRELPRRPTHGTRAIRKRLEHYSDFANTPAQKSGKGEESQEPLPRTYRVRKAVCLFGFSVTTLCITLFGWYLSWLGGWVFGNSEFGNSGRWPILREWWFVLLAALVFAVGIFLSFRWLQRVISTKEVLRKSDLSCRVRKGIVFVNLAIFVVMWFAYLTDGCTAHENVGGSNVCWAKEKPDPPSDQQTTSLISGIRSGALK